MRLHSHKLCAALVPMIAARVLAADPAARPQQFQHQGMCDASAACAVGTEFFAVGNDEDNVIRIYRSDRSGGPVARADFSRFLGVDPKFPEADLEGAAQMGDTIFWITSHGRNQDGKMRASRHRLFATRFNPGNALALEPVGRPYSNLLGDLLADARFPFLRTAPAAEPKARGAINIEGLALAPTNRLLIAFRNPIPRGRAVLVPLINPHEVIQGRRARFEAPILLDLGGYGVRDICWDGDRYWIIGGSYDGSGASRLYSWAGPGTDPVRLGLKFKGLNPEAIVAYPDRLLLCSDDGTRTRVGAGDAPCKKLRDPALKQFRSVVYPIGGHAP